MKKAFRIPCSNITPKITEMLELKNFESKSLDVVKVIFACSDFFDQVRRYNIELVNMRSEMEELKMVSDKNV